eukprot:TRINITY_DN8429_c0_g1_i1.p1 TRINITY_DN8429_c0_g1~~TRINITY_DN8429_c0_g1_i1.p1  ORF type:complete len:495 (+),score=54.18 TRINITY_DN8429_c0_g1_i1:28-1512(+)
MMQSLIQLPDVLGDVFEYFLPTELLIAEGCCRLFRHIVHSRALWYNLFKRKIEAAKWNLPSKTPASWKLLYFGYEKELAVIRLDYVDNMYARFRWRINAISSMRQLQPWKSPRFRFGGGKQDVEEITWCIIVYWDQFNKRVFLRPDSSVNCFFTFNLLNEGVPACSPQDFGLATPDRPLVSLSGIHNFEGARPAGTGFSLARIEATLSKLSDCVVEVDIVLLPTRICTVAPTLRALPLLPAKAQQAVAQSLTHLIKNSACPVQARHRVQRLPEVSNLLTLLERHKADDQLFSAPVGALWNILDTSVIHLSRPLLHKLIQISSDVLTRLLAHSPEASEEEGENPELWRANGKVVGDVCGLLFNVVIVPECREWISADMALLIALHGVLSRSQYVNSHFSCMHIAAQLWLHNNLPNPEICALSTITQYVASAPNRLAQRGCRLSAFLGVELSARDIADFFIPLLGHTTVLSEFGAMVIGLYYYCEAPWGDLFAVEQ